MTLQEKLSEERRIGHAEGRAEGIEKGRAEGIEKGRAEGLQTAYESVTEYLLSTNPSLSREEAEKQARIQVGLQET